MKKKVLVSVGIIVVIITVIGIMLSTKNKSGERTLSYAQLKGIDQSSTDEIEYQYLDTISIDIEQINEESKVAQVSVYIPNLNEIYYEGISADEFFDSFSSIKKDDMIKKQVEVPVSENGGKWEIDSAENIDKCIEDNLDSFFVYLFITNGDIII